MPQADVPVKSSPWKRWSWLLKLGLTLAAFYFVFLNVDVRQLDEMIVKQDHSMILGVAALALFQMWSGATRWQIVLRRLAGREQTTPRHWRVVQMYYISIFFNSCLPGTVGGDVVRVWLAKTEHVPLHLAIHSVVIDRMVTLLGLLLMVFVSLPYVCGQAGLEVWVVMPALLALTVSGIAFLLNLHRLPARLLRTRIGGIIKHLSDSVRQIILHPLTFALAAVLAMVGHVSFCLAAFVLAQSLNIDLTFIEALIYIPTVLLVSVLPISIGGWGVREAGMVAMLGLAGVPAGSALVLSVQLALIVMLVGLPGGLLWLGKRSVAKMAAHKQVSAV